jgi:low temperature requirement protein LtrA
MAGLLVVAPCVPQAFDDRALLFAAAYGVVRYGQVVLLLAARDDPALRRSTFGLAAGTTLVVGLVVTGACRRSSGASPSCSTWASPTSSAQGWKLSPGHFVERHGLIIIIALGESIVAIGVGAEETVVDAGVVVAAALGIGLAAALWWLYFDVVALVAEHRLATAEPGKEQNEVARDSCSYLHFPMVAGIVLVALGLTKTLEHVDEPLKTVPAVAMLGGTAVYLLAHVAFRWRTVHRFSTQRVVAAALLCGLIPLATEVDALLTLAAAVVLLALLIAYETAQFAELRDRMRDQLAEDAYGSRS